MRILDACLEKLEWQLNKDILELWVFGERGVLLILLQLFRQADSQIVVAK